VQLQNDHSISMVPLFGPHDKNLVRYRWKVPEQKVGEFLLWAKSSANSNNDKIKDLLFVEYAYVDGRAFRLLGMSKTGGRSGAYLNGTGV
jgi:hypothetical protein